MEVTPVATKEFVCARVHGRIGLIAACVREQGISRRDASVSSEQLFFCPPFFSPLSRQTDGLMTANKALKSASSVTRPALSGQTRPPARPRTQPGYLQVNRCTSDDGSESSSAISTFDLRRPHGLFLYKTAADSPDIFLFFTLVVPE